MLQHGLYMLESTENNSWNTHRNHYWIDDRHGAIHHHSRIGGEIRVFVCRMLCWRWLLDVLNIYPLVNYGKRLHSCRKSTNYNCAMASSSQTVSHYQRVAVTLPCHLKKNGFLPLLPCFLDVHLFIQFRMTWGCAFWMAFP